MFDLLTRKELSDLHERLYHEHETIVRIMFRPDWTPAVEVGGSTWKLLAAKSDEVTETMGAVYAEMRRRDNAGWDLAKPAMQPRITDA